MDQSASRYRRLAAQSQTPARTGRIQSEKSLIPDSSVLDQPEVFQATQHLFHLLTISACVLARYFRTKEFEDIGEVTWFALDFPAKSLEHCENFPVRS